jgi:hypothetical protein
MTTFAGGMDPKDFYAGLNRQTKIFNVETYGAVHNGTTDDTTSIQAAINACDTAGGGVIYFPIGIYVIGGSIIGNSGGTGYNSQLTIPYLTNTSQARKTFHFKGEVMPNFSQSSGILAGTTQVVPLSGVILKGTLAGNAANQSMLCAGNSTGDNPWTTSNANQVIVENIQFQPVPDGSGRLTIGAINFRGAIDAAVRNVCCMPYNINMVNSGIPQNNCIGIAMPVINAGTHNILDNLYVGGFETGFLLGDHTRLTDVVAVCCLYAYNFPSNYQAITATRIGAYWCANVLYFTVGPTYFKIDEIQTEWYQDSKWYDAAYFILDNSNYGYGQVCYNITSSGIGVDQSKFNKSGGANIRSYPITFASATSFTVTGARDESEGALKDLIAKLVLAGIIVDGTTAS